ncbi:hypothetical protein [Actinokineospora fastidiosa]|uniref:STAS domain-containing protein n=1 Tax=Actinokineospora fastidiosa TaxID=1816 RepID=A0A918GH03_9PSEU|nr:hypothetical protein [Actinokineospora fastidiosa]GGS31990.1 hypothetical protein GCM10010171_27400 [Actinokineospora fastidiosa]
MAAQRGRRTWADTTTRLSVRRLGYALVVTAAGELTPADESAWADLVTAVCLASTRAGMVVIDLTGVATVTEKCLTVLTEANDHCTTHHRDLRVLVRNADEERLRKAALHHLVTAAGMLHRAVSGPRSG